MSFDRGGMDHVEIGTCRLAYRRRGKSAPLLFVHAGIADGRMWDPQVRALERTHLAVVPDLRGFGHTVKPAEPYSDHDDLARLLDHLGLEGTVVVGASNGGAAALDLCLTRPELVAGLVLLCPALGGVAIEDPWLAEKWSEANRRYEAGDHEGAATVELETWLAGPERALDAIEPRRTELARAMLLRSYELDVDAPLLPLEPPACERLAEIAVPTLVARGALDVRGMHAIADRILDGVRGSRGIVFEGSAHLPSLEEPEAFERVLRGFLT